MIIVIISYRTFCILMKLKGLDVLILTSIIIYLSNEKRMNKSNKIEWYFDFQFTVLEKNEQFERIRFPKEHEVNYRWNRAKLERRIILYRPVVRRIFDYWYREFRLVSYLIKRYSRFFLSRVSLHKIFS